MPSFEQLIENNEIIIFVDVSIASGKPTRQYKALLDTGAQLTAIAPRVARDLNIVPIGPWKIMVASGQVVNTVRYQARMDIPIDINVASPSKVESFLFGSELIVGLLPYQPTDYDVILGMDFISLFHITMFRNRIIISN